MITQCQACQPYTLSSLNFILGLVIPGQELWHWHLWVVANSTKVMSLMAHHQSHAALFSPGHMPSLFL